MKKLAVTKPDVSSSMSNLLIVAAVIVASAPVLLGDQLVVVVSGVFQQAGTVLHELSISLQRLFS